MKEKEHQRDVKSLEEVKFTWVRKKDLVSEVHPSAIADHITRNNHTIEWEEVKFPTRNSDTTKRGIQEAIGIKKTVAHTLKTPHGSTDGDYRL